MYSPRTRRVLEKEGDNCPKGKALKNSSRQSEYTPPTSPQVRPENLPPLPPSIPPSPALSSQKSRQPSPAPSITSLNHSSQRSRHSSPAPSSASVASRATLRSLQPTVEDSLSESEEPSSKNSPKVKTGVSLQNQPKANGSNGASDTTAPVPGTPPSSKKSSPHSKDDIPSTVITTISKNKSQVPQNAGSESLSQTSKNKSQPEPKDEAAGPVTTTTATPKVQSQVSRSLRRESPSQTTKKAKTAHESTTSQSGPPQTDIISPSDSAFQQADPPQEQDQASHTTSNHSAIPDPALAAGPSPKSVSAKLDLAKASPSLSPIEARSGNHTPRSPSLTGFPIPPRHLTYHPVYPDPYGSPHMPGYQQGYFYPPPDMPMTAPQGTPPHYPPYGGYNGPPFPMPHSSQRHNSTGSRASAFGEMASPQGGPGGGNGSAVDDDAGGLLSRISSAIPDLHLLLSRYNETRGQLGVREELIRKAEAAQADALKRKEDYIDKLTKELAEAAKHHSNESNKFRLEIGNLEDKRKELQEQIADAEKAKIEMQEATASLEQQKKAVEEEKGSLEAAAKADKETLSKELEDVKNKAAELEESKTKLEETTAKLEEERAKIEADKHQVEEKANEEKRELEKTFAEEKERLQKESEEAQDKLKVESQKALERSKEVSDAEKMALAVEFDRMQKDYHDESERRRMQMIDEHVRDKESLLSEFQRQKRELEESFETVRKELESKLNTALSNYEEALKKERESRDLWNAERESLKKGWDEECEHLKKGWDEQRESLQAQHSAEKENIKKSMEKVQAEAEKKAEDERQAFAKERETMRKEWDEDKASLERVVGELRNIAGRFGAEKERMQKIIEGFGETPVVKSKGDEHYLGAFSRLQRQVLAVSSNHFKKLPDSPSADLQTRLPLGVPNFVGNTLSAAHLRVSYAMYSISKILTNRIFEPFFFSPDGDADASVKLLKEISTQLRKKDPIREATWRQHTLSALFRGHDAKRRINAAASSVVDEICKALEPLLANKIDEELVRAEVRRIVKLAAETWRFACIEREVIYTTLPAPGEACVEDENDLFWPAQHFDSPDYPVSSIGDLDDKDAAIKSSKVLLRLFPVIRREPIRKLPKANSEDAAGITDEGCVYSYGLALYEDSAPVMARLKELGITGGPDGTKDADAPQGDKKDDSAESTSKEESPSGESSKNGSTESGPGPTAGAAAEPGDPAADADNQNKTTEVIEDKKSAEQADGEGKKEEKKGEAPTPENTADAAKVDTLEGEDGKQSVVREEKVKTSDSPNETPRPEGGAKPTKSTDKESNQKPAEGEKARESAQDATKADQPPNNEPTTQDSAEKSDEDKTSADAPQEENTKEKVVENEPANDQSSGDEAADKLAEQKPSEDKPADDKTTEEEPTEGKPTEEEPTEEMPTEEKPTEEMPTEEKPTEEMPTEEKPTEEKPTEEQSAEDKPTEEKLTEEKPTEEQSAEEKSTDEKSADDKPSSSEKLAAKSPNEKAVPEPVGTVSEEAKEGSAGAAPAPEEKGTVDSESKVEEKKEGPKAEYISVPRRYGASSHTFKRGETKKPTPPSSKPASVNGEKSTEEAKATASPRPASPAPSQKAESVKSGKAQSSKSQAPSVKSTKSRKDSATFVEPAAASEKPQTERSSSHARTASRLGRDATDKSERPPYRMVDKPNLQHSGSLKSKHQRKESSGEAREPSVHRRHPSTLVGDHAVPDDAGHAHSTRSSSRLAEGTGSSRSDSVGSRGTVTDNRSAAIKGLYKHQHQT